MQKVDDNLLNSYLCAMCGSQNKKLVDNMRGESILSTDMVCCDCGHVEHFVYTSCGYVKESAIERKEVHCAVYPECIKHCERMECKYRPKIKIKRPEYSIVEYLEPCEKPVVVPEQPKPHYVEHNNQNGYMLPIKYH